MKLVFSGIAFIGPDSETALRAAYAAGLQNRLWNFLDLLYRTRAPRTRAGSRTIFSGRPAHSIPGFDTTR